MNLTNQLKDLDAMQIKSLNSTILDASIAYEAGGNYREIFRRAKCRRVGLMRSIFEMLEQVPEAEIENLSRSLVEIET